MSQDQDPQTRKAVFHFVDGSQLTVEWPRQATKGAFALENAVQKVIEASQFVVEVGGTLLIVQMANVKFIEVVPVPESLPEGIIRGGKRVG